MDNTQHFLPEAENTSFTGEILAGGDQLGCRLVHTPGYVHVAFDQPRRALSSAVLNGGFCSVDHFLNLNVDSSQFKEQLLPEHTLVDFARQQGWQGKILGMMTAASMKSLRVASESIESERIAVLVTTGMENARRAGDPADYRSLTQGIADLGTINAVVITSAWLTPAAMAETLMIASEAKAAIIQEKAVVSPASGKFATGTGTDSVAVIAGGRQNLHAFDSPVRYTGKHTLFGEKTARLMMHCIADSLDYQNTSGR